MIHRPSIWLTHMSWRNAAPPWPSTVSSGQSLKPVSAMSRGLRGSDVEDVDVVELLVVHQHRVQVVAVLPHHGAVGLVGACAVDVEVAEPAYALRGVLRVGDVHQCGAADRATVFAADLVVVHEQVTGEVPRGRQR